MNRSSLIGIFIALLVVGVLIGIYALPKKIVDDEARKAAKDVAGQAVQESARKVAEDDVRKKAVDIAASISTDNKKEAAPTVDLQSLPPVVIDRDAFTVTLPEGSIVDPEKPEIGKQRLTHASLPGHSTISIVVIPSKENAGTYVDGAVTDLKSKVQDAIDATPESLEPFKLTQAKALRGTVSGKGYVFEVGEWDGTEKACIIIAQYPARPSDPAISALQKALRTFKMQQ